MREGHSARPTALATWHAGFAPKSVRRRHGSWFEFVIDMGDADAQEQTAVRAANGFLRDLETTQMTRRYKMVVLQAMVAESAFRGAISLDALTEAVARQGRPSAPVMADLGGSVDDRPALRRLLVESPLAAWAGGKGTSGIAYFEQTGEEFRSLVECPESAREALRELARELCEWRLAQYLERAHAEMDCAPRFVCLVSHSGGRPILFLPERSSWPGVSHGWVTVESDEGLLDLNFVKIDVNVARRPGEEAKGLPDVLRRWFGASAGLPGEKRDEVLFQLEPSGRYRMAPVGRTEAPAGD